MALILCFQAHCVYSSSAEYFNHQLRGICAFARLHGRAPPNTSAMVWGELLHTMGTLCHHSHAMHLRGTSSTVGGTRCCTTRVSTQQDHPGHTKSLEHRPIDRFHRTNHSFKKHTDFTDLPNPFVPPFGVRAVHGPLLGLPRSFGFAGVVCHVVPSCFGICHHQSR